MSDEEPQPQGLGEVSRLTGVFFEPTKTFQDIAERPNFWVPLIIMMVTSITFLVLFSQHVGWERMMRHQMEMSSRTAQLSPEQKEAQVQMLTKFAGVGGYVGAVVFITVGTLIWAAILLLIVKTMMGAPVGLKQIYALLCYSSLPGVIFSVLALAVMFMKAPDDFNMQNPLMFNPGAFMDPTTTSKGLLSLASALDLFTIWKLLLVGLGLKAAGGRSLSMGGAMTAAFLPWVLFILCAAGIASIFA
jgi:hypothetical protein